MRRPLLILLLLPLAGCTLGTRKQAATPPPPQPAAVQPAPPEVPLSVPQTAVILPSQQEFNPDSIPKEVVPEAAAPEKAEAPPVTRSTRRVAAGPQRPEPETEVEAPAAPPIQEQAPIAPILNSGEQKRMKNAIDERRRVIADRLKRGGRSDHDRTLVDRIKSFLEQCAEAEQRGDYSQADALSQRAVVLAQELPE